MNCPICGESVKEDELLVAHYFALKDWWVTRHLKPLPADSKDEPRFVFQGRPYKEWCGQADVQTVVRHI